MITIAGRRWGLGPMAQKKKQLVAAGKLDKYGRPTEATPKVRWFAAVQLCVRDDMLSQADEAHSLVQEYLRALGEDGGPQSTVAGAGPAGLDAAAEAVRWRLQAQHLSVCGLKPLSVPSCVAAAARPLGGEQ